MAHRPRQTRVECLITHGITVLGQLRHAGKLLQTSPFQLGYSWQLKFSADSGSPLPR